MTTLSPHSLRSSLLAGVISLTAAALLLVGGTGAVMLRSYLVGQLDAQLNGAVTAARQAGAGEATEAMQQDPLQAFVSVTPFVIEVRRTDGSTFRLRSSTALPARPLLDSDVPVDAAPRTVTVGGDTQFRVVAVRTVDGAVVLIGSPLAPVRDAVRTLVLTALITSLTVLALLIVLARLLVLRRLRPLDEIAATAAALAEGELDRRVPAPADGRAARTEVGRLSVAINKMLSRIQTAMDAREDSERRMREFVADASHELRTPVTSIRGYLQLVRTGVVDLSGRPDVLRRLEEESARMGALVTDLLYLARLDAEPQLRTAPADLAALIADAAADARAVEPDRPITVAAPAACPVHGDTDTLRQVLANLLGNVRAHTPPGTAVRVRLTGPDPAGHVRVAVADDGPGMTARAAAHAFERFWRADTSRPASGGAGLGLAIVAEAVRAHGGTTGIEAAPGMGTTVWFTLPAAPFTPSSHPARVAPADWSGAMGAHNRSTLRGPSVATLLHRLGMTAVRRRFVVITIWLGVLLAAALSAATLAGKTVNSFDIPGQESTTALSLITQHYGAASNGAGAKVVVQAPAGGTLSPTDLNRLTGELKGLPGVVAAAPPVISPDQRAAYISVTYGTGPGDVTTAQRDALLDTVTRAGAAVTGEATQTQGQVGGPAELIGVVVALIVLALTYGSLVAAGMNLITAIAGVAVGALGIFALTGFVDLSSSTPILAVMLGLAVGIDYALFIVTRFRHELRQGKAVPEAVATAVGTAGSAVLTAGVTVVIALAGLAVAGIPFLTQMGLAAAGTVVIAVLVAITLVPAVLSVIGVRALPRRARAALAAGGGGGEDSPRFFRGWAALVTRLRWASLLVAVIALAIVALPVFAMRTSLNQPPATGSTQERASQILAASFGPGSEGPLLVLVEGADPAGRAATIATKVAALPDVAAVIPARLSPDGAAALVTVVPKSSPGSQDTVDLVHTLRDAVHGPGVYVSGSTAVSVDVSQTLADALPIYLVLVVGLALVLLVLVFRSVLVPLVGVLGFLLTIGASLGATTAVFQWGWLAGVVRSETTGPLLSLAPIILIGILFGLAMDYQVFLVSRMHEAHSQGASPRDAVVTGFRQAAPVVLAAASIMFAVFAGFVPDGDATIKPIGFALAMGILFDAVVIRMIAMPAALALMGSAAWWLPRWLQWLPTVDVEGAALREPALPEPPPQEVLVG